LRCCCATAVAKVGEPPMVRREVRRVWGLAACGGLAVCRIRGRLWKVREVTFWKIGLITVILANRAVAPIP